MAIITVYGSSVADATLTSACDMATATGGVETNKKTVVSGTNIYIEVTSQGSAGLASVSAIPTPTGKGWVYQPGAGTFATGNWSASITLALGAAVGTNSDTTLRFYKYSGGTYTLIGTINKATAVPTTKTTYAFPSTSMSSITFGASDLLYIDLWFHDNQTSTHGDDPIVYESTTTANGVANDMAITTSSFTALVPVLATSPTTLSFSATVGGPSPATQNDTLSETAGAGTAWTSSISYGSGSGWLGIVASSGTLSASGNATIVYTCTTGSLAIGTYTATVTYTATTGGATATVGVTFVVHDITYTDYKTTILPNLVAALAAANLLNNVQVLGTDTTSASDTTWLVQASIDLSSSLSGYVRHAFPPNATDISNDSREVAVKALVSGIYTNDPTSKPIVQGEMGFGYAGPGQSVTLYQYGVDMADYAVQLARAGMAALLAYDLDDDMHGTEWGMGQATAGGTAVPDVLYVMRSFGSTIVGLAGTSSSGGIGPQRPWFWPWSLLSNTLVIGSTLYAPAQPASNDFRCLAAQSPSGTWTVVLINRKSIAQALQVIVPFASLVTTTLSVYTYSQAAPLLIDSNGFPLASGSLSVVLQRGFTVSIAANSVLILTQTSVSVSPPPPPPGPPPPPPPTVPGLPGPTPLGQVTLSTIDVKRPPLEKRR